MSRSGTLTYQIGNELAQLGVGNSTIVGIGGDPVIGSSFIDVIAQFEEDPETELIVMVGEIGGDEEERTADYIGEHVTKPVVAYIAGFEAPPGKRMGHAGRDHLRLVGDGAGEGRGARGQGRAGRAQPDRGGAACAAEKVEGDEPEFAVAARSSHLYPQTVMASPSPISFARGAPSADIMPADATARGGRAVLSTTTRPARSRTGRGTGTRRCASGSPSGTASTRRGSCCSTARSRPG